jgi:CRISPR-associated protein Csd2
MNPKFSKISDCSKKYDFVLLVDIADGNPNGDPDLDNRPRLDEETGQGLMSDVCIKRKMRDYVDIVHDGERRNRIYVMNRGEFLEQVNTNMAEACKEDKAFLAQYSTTVDAKKKLLPNVLADYFCNSYFDVRCFGAVPGKPIENATIRGPIQFQFGRSIDPVYVQEHAIGRVVQNRSSKEGVEDVHGTFGAKHTVRYGLYRFAGHYSAFLAKRTKFNDEDLNLFWEAATGWPSTDSSAARPNMAVRGLYVFKHEDQFGNAPAQDLLGMVQIPAVGNGDVRGWDDYKPRLELPKEGEVMPGVTFHRIVG